MKAMRKQVMEHDVTQWALDFLDALAAVPESHDKSVRPVRSN